MEKEQNYICDSDRLSK